MEGIEDETQLKEQIVVTGAEVHSFSLLPYVRIIHPFVIKKVSNKVSEQASAHIGAGWAGQLHLG